VSYCGERYLQELGSYVLYFRTRIVIFYIMNKNKYCSIILIVVGYLTCCTRKTAVRQFGGELVPHEGK